MKKFEKAILVGHAIYKNANGTKGKKDFNLGEVEQGSLGCLDLENISKIITEKYENFIYNKAKKSQYKLIEVKLDVWTDENTKKEYILKV